MAPRLPLAWCEQGKHSYLAIFEACPVHRHKVWNVRIKTRFNNWTRPDGTKTNEWTFQQLAANAKAAGRAVLSSIFGPDSRTIQEMFVKDIEIWPASRRGIYGKELWAGTAE